MSAALDILPIRQGHVLVIPKEHVSRLSELGGDLAAELGKAVSKVANAMTKGKVFWAQILSPVGEGLIHLVWLRASPRKYRTQRCLQPRVCTG